MLQKGQQQQVGSEQWTYDDNDSSVGPSKWGKLYKAGRHQSPINILVEPNYLALKSATCCAGEVSDKLKLMQIEVRNANRAHLNSTGEEARHPKFRPSTSGHSSACSSSNRSSPTQNSSSDYDYDDDDDLRSDSQMFKEKNCLGKSRLQMQEQNTRFCVTNKKIFLGYPRYLNSLQLTNTGHSWQINLPPELEVHTLLNGPSLGDREYRLAQFHCHWGEDCNHGSEHQINGKSFSAEIHFVHWNCTKFKTIEEASRHKHGLAVLGVLVQALEGEQNKNKHLDKIINGLKRIHKSGSSVSITNARLDLKKLFPTNRWLYASYEGSLTTPPLSEVVDWIVFLNPIQCSTAQIEQFRQIRCSSNGNQNLTKNCRPIQALNDRLVSIWCHH